MTEDQNYYLFWSPEWPENLRPICNTPLKVAQIDMYTKTDEKPVESLWENDHRPEFLFMVGPKMAQKLGLLNLYSPHI